MAMILEKDEDAELFFLRFDCLLLFHQPADRRICYESYEGDSDECRIFRKEQDRNAYPDDSIRKANQETKPWILFKNIQGIKLLKQCASPLLQDPLDSRI